MYNSRLLICTPVELKDLANKIARSMDPDTGGDKSFDSVMATKYNKEYVICDVLIKDNFASQCNIILTNHQILHGLCYQDYSERWSDLIAPTLSECESFISDSFILVLPRDQKSLEDLLIENNFVLLQNNSIYP